MNHELITQLKRLRTIKPDQTFLKNSRNLILAQVAKEKVSAKWPFWIWALAGSFSVLLIAVSFTLSLGTPSTAVSASLDPQTLTWEFNNLKINIALKEINYEEKSKQAINAAIREIGDTKINHLNYSILNNELTNLEIEDGSNEEIDNLLNQLAQ